MAFLTMTKLLYACMIITKPHKHGFFNTYHISGCVSTRMEPVGKKSRVEVSKDTYAVDVAGTQVSFQQHHWTVLNPTTPPSDGLRQYVFQILPTVNSTIHMTSCLVDTDLKLVKQDGSEIDADSQVGM